MKKISTTILAVAFMFTAFSQNNNFVKTNDQTSTTPLISNAKQVIQSKLKASDDAYDENMLKLDSIYSEADDMLYSVIYFQYNDMGQNTLLSSLYSSGEDGELSEEERIEYAYNEKGLENNRVEYAHQGSELGIVSEIDYFYNDEDRLDSMSMLMMIDGELMQLEANVIYNASEQVSSTVMFSDIFDNNELQRVHQIDYHYSDQVLDSIYERTLEQDLSFVWDKTKSFEYYNDEEIEQVLEERKNGTASRDEYIYTADGYLEEMKMHYRETDTWQVDGKMEFTYASNEEVISPIVYTESDVNYLDYGPASEYLFSIQSGTDWEGFMTATHYYSTLGSGTGINTNETEADYFSMYPNPSNGAFTISINGEGNHEVSVFNVSGQRVANEIIATQQTLDISNLDNGYYFVQVSQNGVNLGTKKLIKQ